LSQYLNVLKSHDFYYTNADGRDYQKGKQQKLELKTLYSELSDDEKQKALEAYKVSFKKYYPVEKYSSNPHYNKIYGNIDDWDINSFDGYK